MKQKHLGYFRLGHLNVELLVAPEEDGGEFYLCPDDKAPPRIRVGLNYEHWGEALSVLLHEVLEAALTIRQLRFARTGKLNYDHGDYLYCFDHPEFGNVCSMAGMFLCDAVPLVADEYSKAKRKKK